MTVIAAYYDRERRRGAIGCDTGMWLGDTSLETNTKLFRKHEDIVIGLSGCSIYTRPLREWFFKPPVRLPASDNDADGRKLAENLVDYVRRWAKEHGHGENRQGLWTLDSRLIICSAAGIFVSDGAGDVHEVQEDSCAIGAGSDVAMGAMFWPRQTLNPIIIVGHAVEAAIAVAAGCFGKSVVERFGIWPDEAIE